MMGSRAVEVLLAGGDGEVLLLEHTRRPLANLDSRFVQTLNPRPLLFPRSKLHFATLKSTPSLNLFASKSTVVEKDDSSSSTGGSKSIDVSTFGNLCVDVVVSVPVLPQSSFGEGSSRASFYNFTASLPEKQKWEAGGNCNMAIAASRLGLKCATIGHVGNDIYGKFLLDVLRDEGITGVEMDSDIDVSNNSSALYETLRCWVLVDDFHAHKFFSMSDFRKEPAFGWLTELSENVKITIRQSKILFCNGYGFDELSADLIMNSVEYAIKVGTQVFFDPGPRGKSLSVGTIQEQKALDYFLIMSDVILLTLEEAESLTGIGNPILAGQMLLRKGRRIKWVVIKMGCRGSILVTSSTISCAPAFKVDVVDTVGCGDSFVAAVALGYIHKLPLVSTLAVANAVGAATAMGCGAGRNVADLGKTVGLLRSSTFNEDHGFWYNLLSNSSNYDTPREIILLSTGDVNGSNSRLTHVSLHTLASHIFPLLQSVH